MVPLYIRKEWQLLWSQIRTYVHKYTCFAWEPVVLIIYVPAFLTLIRSGFCSRYFRSTWLSGCGRTWVKRLTGNSKRFTWLGTRTLGKMKMKWWSRELTFLLVARQKMYGFSIYKLTYFPSHILAFSTPTLWVSLPFHQHTLPLSW
jgi:hypothetical protein